jgi:single-strand DNA-binding protein
MLELNKVMLVGNLTRDPETRHIPSGAAVTKFAIALNRRRGKDQEPEVTFIDCEAWEKTAEFIGQWFKKGKPIYVEGRLKMDRWQDRETNQNRTKLVVVVEKAQFADSGREDGAGAGPEGGAAGDGGQRAENSPPPARRAAPAQRSAAPAGGGASKRPPAREEGAGEYSANYGDDAAPTDDDLPF